MNDFNNLTSSPSPSPSPSPTQNLNDQNNGHNNNNNNNNNTLSAKHKLSNETFWHAFTNWDKQEIIAQYGHVSTWDVSNVTDMSLPLNTSHFNGADALDRWREHFNENIQNWMVSNVTNMSNMFAYTNSFDQPLNGWGEKVSKVTNMSGMFFQAQVFNQPLNNWNVSNVTNMSRMFAVTDYFNQPLNDWNVSKVTNMSSMFNSTNEFNQPLDGWDVSNVTDMSEMFADAMVFNQPLDGWDVSKVTTMSDMFINAGEFNQPIDSWNVSSVTDMSKMFAGTYKFNQPLNNWNVSNVTDMSSMFDGAVEFNQPLNQWDVSNVADMSEMFAGADEFSQPLNDWNVSDSADISDMFAGANEFDDRYAPSVTPQIAGENEWNWAEWEPLWTDESIDGLFDTHNDHDGQAYEVHNKFSKMGIRPSEILEKITDHVEAIGTTNDLISDILSTGVTMNMIKKVVGLGEYASESQTNQLTRVWTKAFMPLNKTTTFSAKKFFTPIFALASTPDFPDETKEMWLSTWIHDSAEAYDQGNIRTSCRQGILERFLLNLKDAIRDTIPSDSQTDLQKFLVSKLRIPINEGDIYNEWRGIFADAGGKMRMYKYGNPADERGDTLHKKYPELFEKANQYFNAVAEGEDPENLEKLSASDITKLENSFTAFFIQTLKNVGVPESELEEEIKKYSFEAVKSYLPEQIQNGGKGKSQNKGKGLKSKSNRTLKKGKAILEKRKQTRKPAKRTLKRNGRAKQTKQTKRTKRTKQLSKSNTHKKLKKPNNKHRI